MTEAAAAADSEVLVETRGRLGLLTLNRPRALNALTHGMVLTMRAALDEWALRDDIATVAIVGAGDRGLCAGGDVVSLRGAASRGDLAAAVDFWRDEYRLNARIAGYSKPYVAIMDGVVLGGGIGISAHGSHRIVTERSRLGMPEVGIGFTPDVGGSRLLARAPGELGTHLALTGRPVPGEDGIAVGLADAYVQSARLGALLAALESTEVAAAIADLAEPPPPSALLAARPWIDAAYAGDDARVILARLLRLPHEAAAQAAAALEAASPTALAVTLASLRSAIRMPRLEQALAAEFRIAVRSLTSPDFAEGVRAQLVDKDRTPRWSPRTLAEVDPAAVAAFAAPFTDDERAAGLTEWSAA